MPQHKGNKAVLIYSGGMDSFTLLHYILRHENFELFPISFYYGQKHAKELEFANQVCQQLALPHKLVDIQVIGQLTTQSSLTATDKDIPLGSYTHENMTSTVVPNRNMILLSLAMGYAIDINAKAVYYGAHSGDHELYPDCRPAFVEAMQAIAQIAHYYPIEIRCPFLKASKAEILAQGLAMNLDYSKSWTCYQGEALACGNCGACVERLGAFKTMGQLDPLEYQQ